MISAAIIDDNSADGNLLAQHLARYGEEVGEQVDVSYFSSGFEFLDGYKGTYDVVFIDIEMPEMDGLETAKRLRKFDESVFIVFATNIAKYAIKGYEVGALDYFIKPVKYADFKMRMERVRQSKPYTDNFILIPFQGGMKKLSASEIIYIESVSHDITFHTSDGEILYRGTSMNKLEQQYEKYGFFRCNTCYIVNLRYCKGVNGNVVYIAGEELQISRARKKDFMRALLDSFGR